MRVIAGNLRGKKLLTPKDEGIRPTTDRVKESMFNLISGYIDEDAVVYDLFSGTGGLGIEALSRGAARAYFSDNGRDGYRITGENLDACRLREKAVLKFGSYRKSAAEFPEKADLVFLDPPYDMNLWKEASDYLIENERLNDGAVIVMEHPVENKLNGINKALDLIKEKKYGVIVVSVFCYNSKSEEK